MTSQEFSELKDVLYYLMGRVDDLQAAYRTQTGRDYVRYVGAKERKEPGFITLAAVLAKYNPDVKTMRLR